MNLRKWIHFRDLLREMVVRDMKLRYKRSALGIAWSLLNPLMQLLVFGFVFRLLLPLNIPDYALFLFTGILVWNWLHSSLYSATGAIVDNAALIRQPGFPAAVLPIVSVAANLVNFLLALPVLIVAHLAAGHPLTGAVLALPLLIAVQFTFTLSLAYLLATLHVPYRDTQYMLGVLLMLGFYLAPVFYDSAAIPERYRLFYGLNPLVHLIEGYRSILLHGRMPNLPALLLTGICSVLLLSLACRYFLRMSYRFLDEL